MLLRTLGSAAGGGFPQWNCACRNCSGVRSGLPAFKPRTQAQLAVSGDGRSWFLLGASPDLRAQIEASADLWPSDGLRQSPIAGVALANADLDHVLGLLLLRELQPLRAYATPSVRKILQHDNSMFAMLNRTPNQVEWNEFLPGKRFRLATVRGEDAGLEVEAISLASHFPAYVSPARQAELGAAEASLGFVVSAQSGKTFGYFPSVPQIDDALLARLEALDLLFYDGTFWSDDELIRAQGGGPSARQMGHVPVSGADGVLQRLAGLRRPRKIFVHVNNTNPMLDEAGAEFRAVRAAGWEIAEDGWQFTL